MNRVCDYHTDSEILEDTRPGPLLISHQELQSFRFGRFSIEFYTVLSAIGRERHWGFVSVILYGQWVIVGL